MSTNNKKNLTESLPAPPPSPASSYNIKDNNNNIEEVIKPDIKIPPTESTQSQSTKASDIKISNNFSLFNEKNMTSSIMINKYDNK